MPEPTICAICRKPKVEIRGLSMSQWIFHAGSCICDSENLERQERTAVQVCGRCKKAVTPFRGGSLTQWIFHPAACKCDPEDRVIVSSAPRAVAPYVSSTVDPQIDEPTDEELTRFLGLDPARYSVLRQLGKGRSEVYECLDRILRKRVAVKILSSIGWDESGIIRFQSEARITAGLNHPNLVKLLDFNISQNNHPFVVMELAEGNTLNDLISKQGRMEVLPALNIARQLSDAMDYAHTKNIIHRDLKPSNIVISMNDNKLTTKIIDFGIAMKGEENASGEHSYQGHSFSGTPGYLAPEAILGHSVDSRSDIYSLGTVLFEMLTGEKAFDGASILDTIRLQVERAAPGLSDSFDGSPFDSSLDQLVAKCMCLFPEDRFQSMAELREELVRIEERLQLDSTRAAAPAESLSSSGVTRTNAKSWRIFSAVVAMAFAIFAAFILIDMSSKQNRQQSPVKLQKVVSYRIESILESPEFTIKVTSSDLSIKPRADQVLITDADLPKMISQLKKDKRAQDELKKGRLIKLNLDEHDIDGSGLASIANLPIGNLTLQTTLVTDESLQVLKDFPRLEKVDLFYCDRLTNASVAILGTIPHLKSLMLSGKQLDSRALKDITSMSELESLGLKGIKVGVEEARLLNKLPRFFALKTTSGVITKEGYAELAKNPRFISLFFDNCGMDDQEVRYISQLTQLQQLFFNEVRFTTTDVTPLHKLKRLVSSWLEGCSGVTSAEIKRELPPKCKFTGLG